MSSMIATEKLAYGLSKYGELAATTNSISTLIKKHSTNDSMKKKGVTLKHLREAIVVNGDILEENIDEQSYIAVIQTGFMKATRALVVAVLQDEDIYFAAYAKEGLIKQKLAQKAIELIKDYLS